MDDSKDEQLLIAALKGHHKILARLIKEGANVNAVAARPLCDHKILKYESALMVASHYGRFKCVSLLLEQGADIHYQTPNGKNDALFYSCIQEVHYDSTYRCARLLVEHGADINHQTEDGRTALTWYFEVNSNFVNIDFVKFMVEHGVAISQIDLRKVWHQPVVDYLKAAKESQSLSALLNSHDPGSKGEPLRF